MTVARSFVRSIGRSRRRLLPVVALAAVILTAGGAGLFNGTASALTTTIVVKPSTPNGWVSGPETGGAFDGIAGFVSGPATPPLGTGSAWLRTNTPAAGWAFGKPMAATPLTDFTALSYDTYRASPDAGNILAITLQFNVDYDATDSYLGYQGRIVFEPYQTFPAGVPQATWQHWDAFTGEWWQSPSTPYVGDVAQGSLSCPQSSPCDLTTLLAAYPDAGVHSTFGAVVLKAGSGWAGFSGYADNLTIGILGDDTTYDFEPETPCTTTCYVDTVSGNDTFGGDTPASAKKTIQAGVSAVSVGGTVIVAAGTYDENVVINKALTLVGAGQGATILRPALSNPVCGPGSLCNGASSNVILIQASDVEISDLTVDGDNTSLTSGVVAGGADLDARNGIIENHSAGVWNNTHIHDVTVQNIYLRGIQVGSGGANFIVEDNTVTNVQGEGASIAIFNFLGSGTFDSNNVTDANDGVAANNSRGTTFTNNVVTSSGSGVHSDNNGSSGGVADLLQDNTVTNCDANGYGVWVFASYLATVVRENTVTNCAVGLAHAGNFGGSTTSFLDNVVDGQGLAGSAGVYATTSLFGFGDTNAKSEFTGNKINGTELGFYLEANPTYTLTVDATRNDISGNVDGVQTNGGTVAADFRINWWDSNTGPTHLLNPSGVGDSVADGITYSPWLGIGSDASGNIGFQLASPMTWVAGPAVCNTSCIQAAINYAANGDTVAVTAGTFNEDVAANKSVQILGAGIDVSTIIGPIGGGGSTIHVTAPGVLVDGFTLTRAGNNVTDWNAALNTAGLSVQGQGPTVEFRNSKITGMRTGIDINNSNGNSIHNNIIDNNRTGMILRNQTDSTLVENNFITNNWTIGVLFLDGSGGSNVPPQSAASSSFTDNDISGNWYGQVEDRQAGGSIPPAPTNPKNFELNWWGTTILTVSTVQGGEPGYSAQIPVIFGGTATPPGGQPEIKGTSSANIDYVQFQCFGADTSAAIGFQPSGVLCNPPVVQEVTAATMTDEGWAFYNDETDTVNPALGSFVTGPGTPPYGTGSAQISVSGTQRRNLATYLFAGTPLADITAMRFRTYNPSAGNGGPANRSAYLNFNVDFNGSDTFQRRLVYVPNQNGTVVQDAWQEWDTINGGAALWQYSGPTWPITGQPGTTLKTWAQILADYPGVRIRPTDAFVGLRVGEPYADGYTENIDTFTFGTPAGTTIFDFEKNDDDADGLEDVLDNCPTVNNPGQENVNGEPMPLPKPYPVYDDATNPAGDFEGDACDGDIDGDGLANGTESGLGLSPFVWDTDGDRTNDGTEVTCGTNPLSPVSNLSGLDSDNDRLPNACEPAYGTNPAMSDSDGDGVRDGAEVRYWMSNPLAVNSDGDGCRDGREVASVNHDQAVNAADLGTVASLYGTLSPDYRPLDTNGDGIINPADLGFIASQYGQCTP